MPKKTAPITLSPEIIRIIDLLTYEFECLQEAKTTSKNEYIIKLDLKYHYDKSKNKDTFLNDFVEFQTYFLDLGIFETQNENSEVINQDLDKYTFRHREDYRNESHYKKIHSYKVLNAKKLMKFYEDFVKKEKPEVIVAHGKLDYSNGLLSFNGNKIKQHQVGKSARKVFTRLWSERMHTHKGKYINNGVGISGSELVTRESDKKNLGKTIRTVISNIQREVERKNVAVEIRMSKNKEGLFQLFVTE